MASRPRCAAGLDAGSLVTRCVTGVLEGDHYRFLGYGEAPSEGWVKGRIADPAAISRCVRKAVEEAERTGRVTVESVVLGMGGPTVEGIDNRGVYELGRPREITRVDMKYAMDRASDVHLPGDRMVLHAAPQGFTVDGRAEFRNPSGAIGSRLEAFVHVVTCSAQEHDALVGAVNQAHLAVEETVFEALAAAYAAVTADYRAEGAAIIDIGAHSTDLVVYAGEALMLAASLPVCGDHFTKDAAWGFRVPFDDAERLKREYGCAMVGLTSDSSMIEVPSPEGRPPREATRRELNEILEARAQDLFVRVHRKLAEAGMEQALMEGVFLSGGMALLNGMCDMAERVLNCQAKFALARGIVEWPEELDNPAWTTAAGLALYAARLKHGGDDGRRIPGLPGFLGRFFR